MTTSNLSIAHLEELLAFVKKKLALSLDLEKIEKEIASFFGGGKPAPEAKAPKPPGRKASKIPRGALKNRIIAVLEEAGADGISVAEIAEKLGAKKGSVNQWIYTTGKKVGVTKVARGRFVIKGKTSDAAPAEPSPAKRKPRAQKASGKGSKKAPRGTLKPAILAALQGAPKSGLSLAEVAAKIGAKKNTVNVWFYTTGKKVKGLKKVSKGRFALRG